MYDSTKPVVNQEQSRLKCENGTTSIVFRGVEIVKVTSTGDVTLTTEGHNEVKNNTHKIAISLLFNRVVSLKQRTMF